MTMMRPSRVCCEEVVIRLASLSGRLSTNDARKLPEEKSREKIFLLWKSALIPISLPPFLIGSSRNVLRHRKNENQSRTSTGGRKRNFFAVELVNPLERPQNAAKILKVITKTRLDNNSLKEIFRQWPQAKGEWNNGRGKFLYCGGVRNDYHTFCVVVFRRKTKKFQPNYDCRTDILSSFIGHEKNHFSFSPEKWGK